jgi:hypothetical protein
VLPSKLLSLFLQTVSLSVAVIWWIGDRWPVSAVKWRNLASNPEFLIPSARRRRSPATHTGGIIFLCLCLWLACRARCRCVHFHHNWVLISCLARGLLQCTAQHAMLKGEPCSYHAARTCLCSLRARQWQIGATSTQLTDSTPLAISMTCCLLKILVLHRNIILVFHLLLHERDMHMQMTIVC